MRRRATPAQHRSSKTENYGSTAVAHRTSLLIVTFEREMESHPTQ